jgi:ferredoxin
LCTGDGFCEDACPDVFKSDDDGKIWYVREDAKHFPYANPDLSAQGEKGVAHLGADGMARVPVKLQDAVIDAALGCPGECIFLEPII